MVTDEMVEKAARAMCEAWHYSKIGTPDGDAEWRKKQDQYRKQSRAALEAALSAAEPQPAPSVAVKAIEAVWKYSLVIESSVRRGDGPDQYAGVTEALRLVKEARSALCAQVQDESEIVDCLLAGKPFVFDPATNFCHTDDGGAPEHGIKYVPAAQVQDVAEGWHVASNSGSVLIYCLKQDGWRKGEPVMVNDIMIRVENANRSSNELQPIVDAIMRALPAAPAKQEGSE